MPQLLCSSGFKYDYFGGLKRLRTTALKGSAVAWTHHQIVLHPDDGAVQDGGGHGGDLEQLALQALALALR